jgi:hypothetical protein
MSRPRGGSECSDLFGVSGAGKMTLETRIARLLVAARCHNEAMASMRPNAQVSEKNGLESTSLFDFIQPFK